MTRSSIAIAVFALFATSAATAAPVASGVPITATYQPHTKRYCIRPVTRDEAMAIGAPVHRHSCYSQRQWRLRGVVFTPPFRAPALAPL